MGFFKNIHLLFLISYFLFHFKHTIGLLLFFSSESEYLSLPNKTLFFMRNVESGVYEVAN